MSANGGLIEKIKSGFVEVFTGILDPFVRLFGWISDKILGIFGIEIEGGTAGKIFDTLEWLLPKTMDAIFLPFKLVMGGLKMLTNSLKWVSDKLGIMNTLKQGVDIISDVLGTVFDSFSLL